MVRTARHTGKVGIQTYLSLYERAKSTLNIMEKLLMRKLIVMKINFLGITYFSQYYYAND